MLAELRGRLVAWRPLALPSLPPGSGWSRGVDSDLLRELVRHWAESYDWRRHEEQIRSLPWAAAESPLGPLRLLRKPARDRGAPTVVLLHGWPDSVLRFTRLIPLLDDLDVIVPALPGFPFAPPLTRPGMSVTAMADLVAAALAELGCDHYVVSGGDIGGSVAEAIAGAHPDRVGALHLTEVTYRHLHEGHEQLGAAELSFLGEFQRWRETEGAYGLEQSTKPHTLAQGLADSPVGLAAWMIEKLHRWSDCDGDLERTFPRDDLLTWVTAYSVTGTIGTSFSAYVEEPRRYGRARVPTAVTIFPRDLLTAPRELGERCFDLRIWTEAPAGGHFGAWEQPQLYAEELRRALALVDE